MLIVVFILILQPGEQVDVPETCKADNRGSNACRKGEISRYRQQLIDLWTKHEPGELHKVDKVMKNYAGHEREIFFHLQAKTDQ